MKRIVKIVLGILIILVIACVMIFNFIKKDNSNGNLSNMGLVTEYKGVTYYNKYEKGIFSNKNGNEKQLTEETAYSLNAVDDKIYYMTVADFNNVTIKYFDLKNESIKNVATVYTSNSKFYVDNNYIYYLSNSSGICRIDLNGENEERIINENIQDFQIYNDKFFYVSNNQILSANKNGENNVLLNEETFAKKIQVVEKWIYYYNENENSLFRVNFDGSKNEVVSVLVNNETYNISGKYVYYLDENNSKIVRMQLNKTNKCNDVANISVSKTKINIAGNVIYYLDKSIDESQTYQIFRVKNNGKEIQNIKY